MGAQLPQRKGYSSPHFLANIYCGQTVTHLSNCYSSCWSRKWHPQRRHVAPCIARNTVLVALCFRLVNKFKRSVPAFSALRLAAFRNRDDRRKSDLYTHGRNQRRVALFWDPQSTDFFSRMDYMGTSKVIRSHGNVDLGRQMSNEDVL